MTPRIDEEPLDLDLTWGKDDISDVPYIPIEMPKERKGCRPYFGVVAVTIAMLFLFGIGVAIGARDGNRLAEEAITEAQEAQELASISASAAAEWQARAVETSASITALQEHVGDLELQLDDMEFALGEATQTIKALTRERDRLKELKATKAKAPTVQAASASTGSWSTAKVSWYGPGFYGNKTANGDVLTTDMMNVAHRSMRFGTRIEFSYNGKTCIAVVNDRGPFVSGRTFDLGPGTAKALGFSGVGTVKWREV